MATPKKGCQTDCAVRCSKPQASSCGGGGVDPEVLKKLEEGFKKLSSSNATSLLKKYLTKDVFDRLKNKKTSFCSTLLDCVQSGKSDKAVMVFGFESRVVPNYFSAFIGFENLDSQCGIYAPDPEAYKVFGEIFDPIIEDYHMGFKKTDRHPATDWGNTDSIGNVDPAGKYVISTRVRCGRSVQGYPFNPCLNETQYREIEKKVSGALLDMKGELSGKYYALATMTKKDQQQLIDDHFLFKEGDRFLQAANACRYWPTGRGIFHNDNRTFLVWINEEDHIRIISMQNGGNVGEVYKRLVTAVGDIEKKFKFSRDNRLGFLTFCPTNLGE